MITLIDKSDERYPANLNSHLGSEAPGAIHALGNLDILKNRKIGFFCSSKCPGDLIIKTYDLAKKWREDGVAVIGGFHSPVEQECLTILLRGKQPVIVCPARSLDGMRIKEEYKRPLEAGRLLLVSAADKKERRITSATSQIRNRLVAAVADEIFIAHAEPLSKTEQLCKQTVAWGKRVYAFSSTSNTNLLSLGAKPIENSGL